jgi:hypothetical protein
MWGVLILAAFWRKLFQLAASPFNWIHLVMEDVGEKVGRMLNEEASRNISVEGQDEQEEETTMEGLSKKYPWWSPVAAIAKTAARLTRCRTQPPCSRGRVRGCDDAEMTTTGECCAAYTRQQLSAVHFISQIIKND